jgi:HAD superfamily hydrolase (TIGR01509 family)
MTVPFTVSDWAEIRLVVFDVDGTLYRQSTLRLKMAREMLLHAVMKCDLDAMRIIRAYRRIRERLADEEVADFEPRLIAETATATSCSADAVRAIVSEWMLERPLPHLRACVYTGIPQLFAALRREGKMIGILSDYPAEAKLAAMGLAADHVISASDVGMQKPHPKGLQTLMSVAGVAARETVLIGDRAERDGRAGKRAGVRTLIRSSRRIDGYQTFATYHDPLFAIFQKA